MGVGESEHRLYREQELRIAAQVRQLPDGENLLKNQSSGRQIIPKIAYLSPDLDRTQRAQELLAAGQIGVPAFVPETNTFIFTCYSSQALEIERVSIQYTISVGMDGVVTCTCPDFENHGGACKHIRGALFLLDHLHGKGINVPVILIPSLLTEAHALQTQTAIYRAGKSVVSMEKSATPTECPTVRAAAAVADLLRGDESCVAIPSDGDTDAVESEAEKGDESDSDVDTDASSDSEEEDGPAERAASNLAALGEQVLARTIYELQDFGPKAGDLAEFMKRKSGPLSDAERDALSQGHGHLAVLLGEINRLLFSVGMLSLTQSASQLTQRAVPHTTQGSAAQKRKPNRSLEAPSLEKRASKRHESHAPH
ncbi:hypothetical protein C8R44DRAFT_749496 [Mycena epipterygia]|nr:hypothetical protein C8R44DRAFT_749496 [Mycena epipterygia]